MSTDSEYFERLGNIWVPNGFASLWWLLFALPALYFFETLIHEGTHGLTALVVTRDFPKLMPFPHYNTAFDGFVNGVTFTGGRGFVAAPQAIALGLIVVFTLILLLWPIRNHLARFALRTWYLGACLDLLYNSVKGLWGGPSPISDWGKLEAQISTPGIIALTWGLWLFVLSHFAWAPYSAWGRQRPERKGFWGYRGVALLLGLLSLAAILFATFVNDPTIVKAHVFFIAPLIGQAIALLWYSTYVVLTFSDRGP
jgi:hypothetical protein